MNKKKQNSLVTILSVLICLLVIPKCYSSTLEDTATIPLSGGWEPTSETKPTRSIPLFPIEASTDGTTIRILNSAPDCDIHISIINNLTGITEIEQSVPETATAYITIPIDKLNSGNYTLQLSNIQGGNLQGIFNK